MPTYSYTAFDSTGRLATGTIVAASAADAAAALNQRGLIPTAVETSVGDVPTDRLATRVTLKPDDLVALTRQLATLQSASVPLVEALRLVAAGQPRARLAIAAARLADQMSAGHALSQATARTLDGFPAHIAALIAAGESSGKIAQALAEAATLLERSHATRARIRAALVYPAILLVVALAAIGIVVTVLVPALLPLFADSGRTPPAALTIVNSAITWALAHWIWLVVLVAGSAVALRKLARTPTARAMLDRAVLKAPLMGSLLRARDTALTARTLGFLLAAGVPLVEALRLSADVPVSSTISLGLIDAAERVKEGTALSQALAANAALDPLAVRFIAIGEQSSRLDQMLLHLADAAEQDSTRRLDTVLTLLSPMLTILIGVLVGGLILSVLQAILSFNDLVAR